MDGLEKKWKKLLSDLQINFEEELSLKPILFLVGVQELSQGIRDFDKEEETNLIHIAICRLLSEYGYYKFKSLDEDGWPHWEQVKDVGALSASDQTILLKKSILKYFDNY